jgi:hypothetical protein
VSTDPAVRAALPVGEPTLAPRTWEPKPAPPTWVFERTRSEYVVPRPSELHPSARTPALELPASVARRARPTRARSYSDALASEAGEETSLWWQLMQAASERRWVVTMVVTAAAAAGAVAAAMALR